MLCQSLPKFGPGAFVPLHSSSVILSSALSECPVEITRYTYLSSMLLMRETTNVHNLGACGHSCPHLCNKWSAKGPKRKLDHTPNPPGQRHLQKGAWFSQAFRCTRLVLATRACLHFAHPRHSLGRPSRQSQPIGAEDSTQWAGFQVD